MMNILLSNDDGYFAEGLTVLQDTLKNIADVCVVAPERNRSGASNSLTLDRPLNVRQISPNFYYVNGTPTDCVHLAVTGLLTKLPDMIISGINNGANMGDDTIYSGTVAAAMEGFLLGIPSIAISMAQHDPQYYETAAQIAVSLIRHYKKNPFDDAVLLNVNVPDIPHHTLKGYAITRLGKRHPAQNVIPTKSPRGETVYWVGAAGAEQDNGKGTDFYAITQNQVSITPLQADLTNKQQLSMLDSWRNDFN